MRLLYIDLFCGAGGTSTGVESAHINGKKIAKVIACVNHDTNAIASHAANHPYALHYIEDIRTLELTPLLCHVNDMRQQHPDARLVLWASLECTNFSKAKGGLPRDPDSRTLAEHLYRYIETLNPDYIQIENVEEFMSWGDLDENGKPVSKDAGRSYRIWVDNVKGYGYEFDYRILNSADFGAYTSRRRYFGQFAKHGLPICWPEPTHSKDGDDGIPGKLKKWKAVREVLDLQDIGDSVFDRRKPLVDATLARIYAGLVKFVAGGKEAFIVKYNSMKNFRYNAPGIDSPCSAIVTRNCHYLTSVKFLSKNFSGHPKSKNLSIEEPAHTIRTKDCIAIVSSQFMDMQYGNGRLAEVGAPAPTITANPKHKLVMCAPWVMSTHFTNVGSPLDKPCPTVTANRKHHYLMNPQFKSSGGSVDNPCFTLIARMDKMPPYLVSANNETDKLPSFIKQVDNGLIYELYPEDSEIMVKIKEFMAMYLLVNIFMRMLRIAELKQIQGFSKDYILVGTKQEQKKYIGNAVVTLVAEAMCVATVTGLLKNDNLAYEHR